MNKLLMYLRRQSLQKKWMLTSSIVIFLSYTIICVVVYISLHTWLLNDEESKVERTSRDIISFLQSQGQDITIQQIQQNTGLLKSIVDRDETVRMFNADGVDILRINNTSAAAPLSSMQEIFETTIDKQDVLVMNEPIRLGFFQGYVQVVHPLTGFQSLMHYLLTAMLIAGLGALVLSGSIGYYLANYLMKPLRELRASMKTVMDQGFNEPIQLTYTSHDEIGDLLKMYNAMMNELQISFTQQQQFVADASHELRTPIQAIEGHLSLLKRWGKNDPAILEESIDTSLTEIARMRKMIEELLELARREEKDEMSEANALSVIEAVIDEMRLVHPRARILLSKNDEMGPLFITENALSQIIRNIIENAIRYCEKIPEIQISISVAGNYACLEIADNGIGIAKDNIPFIFDRFYRVDEARNRQIGGTGLGLSISKMLLEKYNATVEVKSEVNIGTVFSLKIPLKY
ncbi:HAMP domain-containing histidine kinase [Lysinibacillus sp. FSL R7-0073]|uniref:Signal transduction histidine-protein kinase ArlS n=1 Tax=Lysinibacillus fusiformis TaxID=28031 RepID=A0A1E4R765_9BACI|nr:HAMP domain-containing histidine kinase [Lysinibacillus fusiformis]MBD8521086.1 HAMP domain-containing protein [Lysinibacillus fusiformis]MCR8852689.1 HAMP domain-containing histidine kinase [Lysinibacillus fusiformis]MED4886608.1 HAMP domain-containing histidine kinase [Lysinibacillus fusiformis]ODV56283.1 two-component sensor histidine kinase [Lysinibacillus fusiformis]WKT79152.1 HAMP domain-containing histidine kinase [Lysinibacillus fusiformis]